MKWIGENQLGVYGLYAQHNEKFAIAQVKIDQTLCGEAGVILNGVKHYFQFTHHAGLFSKTTDITAHPTGQNQGRVLQNLFDSGELTLAEGRRYWWDYSAWSETDRAWLNADKNILLRYDMQSKDQAYLPMLVTPPDSTLAADFAADLPLLMVLGWYLVVLEESKTGTKKLAGQPVIIANDDGNAPAPDKTTPDKPQNITFNLVDVGLTLLDVLWWR
ncbi:MAG: hypothetical protein KIH69_014800 [Anaerolineae bacterium]|nr:hypothetical protein [Anaerolineae bacterium]